LLTFLIQSGVIKEEDYAAFCAARKKEMEDAIAAAIAKAKEQEAADAPTQEPLPPATNGEAKIILAE
jgi:hypothetical protein